MSLKLQQTQTESDLTPARICRLDEVTEMGVRWQGADTSLLRGVIYIEIEEWAFDLGRRESAFVRKEKEKALAQ